MSATTAVLYVVATPIGNLEDMTPRAIRILKQVDLIAAEDTRHSGKLLSHFDIGTATTSLHEHNERDQVPSLIESMRGGKSIALISDAGTPLVSDPGYRLVHSARAAGIAVVPVPGACAAIAALCIAGLPTDRFVFEGFPPARAAARRAAFRALASEPRTVIFYESAHRIVESLADMATEFGAQRRATVTRELTKAFESVYDGVLGELHERLARDPKRRLGEFVVLVQGAPADADDVGADAERVLRILLAELPLKQAVALAAELTGGHKNALYRQAIAWQKRPDE